MNRPDHNQKGNDTIMADKVYDESMCKIAEQILSKGKSIARLSVELDVCRDTIYQWRDKHPEFARALKKGLDACQTYWEDLGEQGMRGQIKNFGGTAWIFTMKNRFRADYKEEKNEKSALESFAEKILERKLIE